MLRHELHGLRISHVSVVRKRVRQITVRRSGVGQKNPEAPLLPLKPSASSIKQTKEGPSTEFNIIWGRLLKLGLPYWAAGGGGPKARWKLAGVFALTLGTTGVSVLFNFLGRDFFNALSQKDVEHFYQMLGKWLGALVLGIPVFVMRDFYQSTLALDWRDWMTRKITADYFADRAFYQIQAGELVDNPDQRIAADVRQFTDTALGFSTGILNALIDLISFSGILYTIYPPLFVALLVYSVGGTAISLQLGKPLVGLNFRQEAREADFRFGMVRVRENAESVAFYGGEASEQRLLFGRLQALVENAFQLLRTERNLQFFTSFYRFLIGILPAAVVAPLYFEGKIEFGVVNQSSSAFNHILSDVSLVVFQFESIAGFSAIIDRLGEFAEVLEPSSRSFPSPSADSGTSQTQPAAKTTASAESSDDSPRQHSESAASAITLEDVLTTETGPLLRLQNLTLRAPGGAATLVEDVSVEVSQEEDLLIVGPSGAGKTSILRAVAGLWSTGSGHIQRFGKPVTAGSGCGDIFFVPQRPYVVLGTLREQLLYPTWSNCEQPTTSAPVPGSSDNGAAAVDDQSEAKPLPSDEDLRQVLERVRLGLLLDRGGQESSAAEASPSGQGLDHLADWGGILSLGEQQRLAFARVLLTQPRLVLMDESTSALDTDNEAHLFGCLRAAGIRYVSVGHRPTLKQFHSKVLRLVPRDAETAAAARSSWEVTKTDSELSAA